MIDISQIPDEEIAKIESKLFKAYAQMAGIINSSEDAIVSMSPEGKILSWNRGAKAIYGYGFEELTGKDVDALCPSNHQNELTQMVNRVINKEPIKNHETEHIRKDGKIINVSITISPIKDESEKIYAVSMISRDITEQKESEKKLSRYNEIDMMNKLMVDREVKMAELKEEIKRLKAELGRKS